MPIHINLLAEAKAAEDLRRRDPVKRAIYIGVSLVLALLVWSGMVEMDVIMAKQSLTGMQIAIDVKTNAYQRVSAQQKKNAVIQVKL